MFEEGMTAARAGRQAEAAQCFEQALRSSPEFAAAHRELARARIELDDLEAAADALELAGHFNPGDAWTHFLLGLLAQRRGAAAPAIAHYRRALELEPEFAEAHNNLGYLLANDHDLADQAIAHFEAALRAKPHYVDAMINLGQADLYAGRRVQAIARFDAILALNPGVADAQLAHLNRALGRLALRRWDAWDEYEARRQALALWTPRPFAFAEWDGLPAPGRTLLIYGEQGLGDEIMFASCIPDAARTTGRCIIECSPRLVPLFSRSFAGCQVVAASDDAGWLRAAPAIDLQIASGSLPRLFRRTAGSFPVHQGYLRADAAKAAAWRARLAALGPQPKIALSWRGGTAASRQAKRSIAAAGLAGALQGLAADFISLQYGEVGPDLEAFASRGVHLNHWPEVVADYDETAALLEGVDLVVSVCTALIHLGGALGRPVWVLTPAFPEWRYGDSGEDMPWYPSVRLLRQNSPGDWISLLQTLQGELRKKYPA
jgi:tetratricopeptide (TPR) repeat protein